MLESATMLTQLQYALKRTGGYGRWSKVTVSSWPEFEWQFHGKVPARAFRPVPSVDSGILRIERRATPLLARAQRRTFDRVVGSAFLGVGGSVGASLRREFGARAANRALERAGIDAGSPVGFVHPDAWLRAAAILAESDLVGASRDRSRPLTPRRTAPKSPRHPRG
jgi:23S rRNA (adenine-N6)-dimethyltransferase